ncbi:cystatin-B-like [Protopterus annectens]|uniref:cystatin-B-like n=1 Tax=Protopterus annectens TaxID=7888 RepID=UPI001CFB3D96|nr:cystatin-B-like [Protopterus annectens]
MGDFMPGRICGGTSEVKPATPEIQSLCDQIRAAAEEKAGRKFSDFKAVFFRSQCVQGANYFVKVADGDECVHVRIYKKLPCYGGEISLDGIQTSKTHEDPLVYF